MRLQLLSDLHLEAHPHFRGAPVRQADLLVLAGDIGSYQAGSQLDDDDFGLGRFAPARGWPTPVLYVPGNHEYDGQDFDAAHLRLRETCERLGMIWLERAVHVQQGVRFVGTTLWSDFDGLSDAAALPGEVLRRREKAFRAANFYLTQAATTRNGRPWLAAEMRDQALTCIAWLRQALAEPFDGPTVAITHFAPSLASLDPRYGTAPGTAGFCNALDDLLPAARLWLHGHLHCAHDYRRNGCRVVANPLGYLRKGEQELFRPNLAIEVPGL